MPLRRLGFFEQMRMAYVIARAESFFSDLLMTQVSN